MIIIGICIFVFLAIVLGIRKDRFAWLVLFTLSIEITACLAVMVSIFIDKDIALSLLGTVVISGLIGSLVFYPLDHYLRKKTLEREN